MMRIIILDCNDYIQYGDDMSYTAKTDTAFELLRRDILNGIHAPDEPLRISSLSTLYGVSATPLREALSRLEEKRLVVASANRGWRVAPVSLAELGDLEFARLSIESALLEDSIAHGDLSWESGIVAAHHRLSQTRPPLGDADRETRQAWMEAHDGFHLALIAAGRSSWLRGFHMQVTEQLQRHHQALLYHPRRINPDGPDHHLPETTDLLRRAHAMEPHTQLMQVALDRAAAQAKEMLAAHIEITLTVYRSIVNAVKDDNKNTNSEETTK